MSTPEEVRFNAAVMAQIEQRELAKRLDRLATDAAIEADNRRRAAERAEEHERLTEGWREGR